MTLLNKQDDITLDVVYITSDSMIIVKTGNNLTSSYLRYIKPTCCNSIAPLSFDTFVSPWHEYWRLNTLFLADQVSYPVLGGLIMLDQWEES